MKKYDLMLMLDPEAPEEQRTQVLDSARKEIASNGKLIGTDDWGEKKMEYEIDHRKSAFYYLFQFESEPPLLKELDRKLKISEGLLRFRIIDQTGVKPGPGRPDRKDRDSRPRRDSAPARPAPVKDEAVAGDAPAAAAPEPAAEPKVEAPVAETEA